MNIRFQTIGAEHQPLLVADDFYSSPEMLVESARHQNFIVDKTFYPGVRAPAPRGYAHELALFINTTVLPYFNAEDCIVDSLFATFACVTTTPENLHVLQRIPHFDSNNARQLACIHYLTRPESSLGGTAFYKHNKTTYEYVDEQRVGTYKQVLVDQIKDGQIENPPRYICGNNRMFSQIHCEAASYNKLVVYKSTSLHSGLITTEYLHRGNPADGRLTITSFIALSSAPSR